MSAVKRALRDGGYPRVKVGHGGTLDPLATGVLPIALGEATKLAGRMLDASKVYEFEVTFGVQTDTLDAAGVAVATSEARPTLGEVEAVLSRFTGPIEQVPPAYSALKVDGARAYDLARAGEEVVLPTRAVTVFALELKKCHPQPLHEGVEGLGVGSSALDSVTFIAHVSKGTYIRSLARDIALALGTVGHVTMLRRTRAGPFDLAQAISLDKLAAAAKESALEAAALLLPLEAGLDGIPALSLTPDQSALLKQGRVVAGIAAPDGLHLAKLGDLPIALAEVQAGHLRVVRGFNL